MWKMKMFKLWVGRNKYLSKICKQQAHFRLAGSKSTPGFIFAFSSGPPWIINGRPLSAKWNTLLVICDKTHNFGPRYTWSWKFRFYFSWNSWKAESSDTNSQGLILKNHTLNFNLPLWLNHHKWHCGDLGPIAHDLSHIRIHLNLLFDKNNFNLA